VQAKVVSKVNGENGMVAYICLVGLTSCKWI
jgi:hypothetical protein